MTAADGTTTTGPIVSGTPRAPDLAPRKRLFLVLLGVYVVWMGLLIATSIAQHRGNG